MTVQGYRNCGHNPEYIRRDPAGVGFTFSPYAKDTEPDSFEPSHKAEAHKERKEKFTFSKGITSFFKGMVSPFVEMLKHPLETLGIAAVLGFVARKVPAAGKFLAIGGLIIGGIQFLSGFGKAVSGMTSGNGEEAEKGFRNMGSGTIGAVMSALGLRLKVNGKTLKEADISTIGKDSQASYKATSSAVKNLFNKQNSQAQITSLAGKNNAREAGRMIGTGAVLGVPFIGIMHSGSSSESGEAESHKSEAKEKSEENPNEPLVMRMAERAKKLT